MRILKMVVLCTEYTDLQCVNIWSILYTNSNNFRRNTWWTVCWKTLPFYRWVLDIVTEKRYTERKLTLDNLNFCVTRSTRHAKSSSQCRRWNFIAKDRENAVRKVKMAFFLKMRYPWNCRKSDHFYWFPFIKSVNITFYFAKVCFFPLSTPY
jgi:hypothetical protein